jgi:hypothetical protein
MVAAAFTATLIFKGAKSQNTIHQRATISDVAGAYWVFPDGNSFLQLPSDEPYYLVDVIVVTGGTDTTQSQLFVNQKNTGLVLDHKSNLNSSQYRQFINNPLGFKPAALIRLTQAA